MPKLEGEDSKAHAGADSEAARAVRDKMQALKEAIDAAGLTATNPGLTAVADDLITNINSILSPTGAMPS